MLKNIVFMMIGAVIMFAVLTLLEPRQTETPPVPQSAISTDQLDKSDNADPSTASNSDLQSPIDSAAVTNSVESDPSAQAPRSGQMTDDVAKAMIASKTQILKSRFRQLFKSNSLKADQLTELANEKLSRDMELMRMSISQAFSDEERALMQAQDNELTPDEFEQKQRLLMQQEELRDLREESRIEFEDGARNLLTNSELEAFRQQERDTAQENFERRAEMWSTAIRANVSDLNDYQLSEIDRISQLHSTSQIELVPIGSTIGSDLQFSTSDETALGRLISELLSVLSEQQQTGFRSQPVILTP